MEKRKSILVSEETHGALKNLAGRRGMTMDALLAELAERAVISQESG